jgi:hypothetical protein
MIERFVARVGRLGAILILAAAVLVIGLGGGVVEHFRLAAQQEQQGEQTGSQSTSKQDAQANGDSKQGEQAGNEDKTQGEDQASGARQQGQQSGSTNQAATSGASQAQTQGN